jgi:uncharacterized protein (DUF433 family)
MGIPVNHIQLVDGTPVIREQNVKVKMIVYMYLKAGASIEAIIEQYGLTHAQFHSALAYYYDNQEEFEEADRNREEMIEPIKKESAARLERMRSKRREIEDN